MPAIVTLPRSPETSLGRLGDVLLGSATDYAEKRRFDTREARLRAERLADIESERSYARGEGDRQHERARGEHLADIKDTRGYEETIHGRGRGEKLTDLEDERDWVMRMKMWENLQRDNPAGLKDAQTRLNQLANDEAGVIQRMTAREQSLAAPEPQPNPAEIEKIATERARAAIPKAKWYEGQKTEPSRKEIADQIPAVTEELRTQINAAWQRARLDNQEIQRIDAVQLQRIGAEKNVITNVFRRVGIADGSATQGAPAGATRNLTEAPAGAAPGAKPNIAAAQQVFASDITNAVRGARGGMTQRQPTGPPLPPELLSDPEADYKATLAPGTPRIRMPGAPAGTPQSAGPNISLPPAPVINQLAEPNPYLGNVTAPAEVRSPTGGLLRTPRDSQNARNSDYVEDFVRKSGHFLSNLMPASIEGSADPRAFQTAQNNPAIRARAIQQLQARLSAISETGSPLEADIRFQLDQLMKMQRAEDQNLTRSAQLIEPQNTAVTSTPGIVQRGMTSRRLLEPAY